MVYRTEREVLVDRLLTRGTVDVVVRERLRARLLGDRPLRVKLGVDPTRPDIHLGHYVCFRKLREFQSLGHQVVVIIGDWTARIGDPSGRSAQRPMLTAEEVAANAQTYLDQFFKVVDVSRAEIVWQSTWFGTFTLEDVIRLASKYTVAKLLTREDFARRYEQGSAISITELLYPLLQAYDSVAIQADVEIGGTDQLFNLLVGRDIMREYGLEPQDVLTVPLLVGTDGTLKMSKSYGNYIAVNELPEEMFGKIMSIPDHVLGDYLRLLTDLPDEEIDDMVARMATGSLNPRDVKERLATIIVSDLHSPEAAARARDYFHRVHRLRELPEELPEIAVPTRARVIDYIVRAGFARTNNEARRLVLQGGVRLDGQRVDDPEAVLELREPIVLQVGKRRFARLVPKLPKG
ncbi:tyrosine--tRNA ligase [Thermomicrobium sp. CFH 73360]|uniref:tyrosine--tRNA ligase n=1 Tax=Thermomicrobium sp. CFH 73360 TaxID=2951987 RepID=UPI0020774A58|nr:tyrosine--tRNA ligase [Thermomicrobium sp. CFH 73360]MCM8746666.1 tyrosine--tRNA ligase [Thermomicrobium sp. CFH 73360]